MLLFPLPLARNKENENIESRILIDCAPHTMILVYTLPAALKGKDCCRRGRILCPRYELTRIKNSFSKISTPCLTFLIPFVIINAEF